MIFDALLKYKQLRNAVEKNSPDALDCFDQAEDKVKSITILADVATCVSDKVGLNKQYVRGNIEEIDVLIDYIRNL